MLLRLSEQSNKKPGLKVKARHSEILKLGCYPIINVQKISDQPGWFSGSVLVHRLKSLRFKSLPRHLVVEVRSSLPSSFCCLYLLQPLRLVQSGEKHGRGDKQQTHLKLSTFKNLIVECVPTATKSNQKSHTFMSFCCLLHTTQTLY